MMVLCIRILAITIVLLYCDEISLWSDSDDSLLSDMQMEFCCDFKAITEGAFGCSIPRLRASWRWLASIQCCRNHLYAHKR
ncbi:hypothetical protein BGX38DRAFT_1228571 [Terfezia claveryi]|nr:hypothetical protein BGX38DRAFT_1228571 [Terfezia claveryi]